MHSLFNKIHGIRSFFNLKNSIKLAIIGKTSIDLHEYCLKNIFFFRFIFIVKLPLNEIKSVTKNWLLSKKRSN